jgi:hypothetical protein
VPVGRPSSPHCTSPAAGAASTRAGWRAASAVVAGLVCAGGVTPAEAAGTCSAPLRGAAKTLPVAAENDTGHDRTRRFGDGNDVGEVDAAEGVDLPGADLSHEEPTLAVVPERDDAFACASCFLFRRRSRLAHQPGEVRCCTDCKG